jgi:excinuclease ABC subunit B
VYQVLEKHLRLQNVVKEIQKPTLVLAHNKTLASELYSELKQFFLQNTVEYFVSYYDYYQPEASIPFIRPYIEKDLSINDDIERLRIRATSSLLSGRRDVLIVASVSCLYRIGNPEEFNKNVIPLQVNQQTSRTNFLHQLVQSLYSRTKVEIRSGTFKVKGDVVTIYPSYGDHGYRVHFFGDEIEEIEPFSRLGAVKSAANTMGETFTKSYDVEFTTIQIVSFWTFIFIYLSFALLKKRDL